MQQPSLIEIFIAPLESGSIGYMVTGSIAATFYGEPRLTHDIDLVLSLQSSDIGRFLSMFPAEEFYQPPYEVVRLELSRQTHAHFNLIHHDTGYKADFYPLSNDQLHRWGYENRRRIRIKEGLEVWLAPPEYVIVRKLQYFKEGGSQKHLSDIKKMLDSPESVIDRTTVKHWVGIKGVEKEWMLAEKYIG